MKSVIYRSSTLLSCGCGNEVFICVDNFLVAGGAPVITGVISLVNKLITDCECAYNYSIIYDEGQLLDPHYTLTETDISGILCKGCLTTYIDYRTLSAGITTTNTDTLLLTFAGGNLLGNVKIASAASNILSVIAGDGLWAPQTYPDSSPTIHFTSIGPTEFTGDVLISANPRNSISVLADGIYSPTLISIDTASIAFGIPTPNQITASVKISASPGNTIVGHADGLFAAGGGAGSGWALGGNTGLIDGVTNLLGTLDNIPIRLVANGVEVGHCIPNVTSSIWLLGPTTNTHTTYLAELMLGGSNNAIATDVTENPYVPGGGHTYTSIISGFGNTLKGTCDNSSIFGANSALISCATNSAIVGGVSNSIIPYALTHYQTAITETSGIFAGRTNVLLSSKSSTIIGGASNYMKESYTSSILGGLANELDGFDTGLSTPAPVNHSSIIGGTQNILALAHDSTILGGAINVIRNVTYNVRPVGSVILGGLKNSLDGTLTTDIQYSSILGGIGLKLGASSVGYQGSNYVPTNYVNLGVYTQTDLSSFSQIAYFGDVDFWIGNVKNVARKIKFFSPNLATNYAGATYSSLESQAQAANLEYKLPAAAGAPGTSLKIQSVVGTVVTLEWA